jgi:transposase
VLLAASGWTNAGIARKLGIAPNTASKWRKRYATQGVDGLRDRKRPGRPRVFAARLLREPTASSPR